MADSKVAVISGASSGIGLCTAAALRDDGYTVFDLSRSGHDHDGIIHIDCDVTDERMIASAVEEIVVRAGRIDVVINCAGFGISGAVEFTETQDAKKLFDVNFFGMVSLNRACFGELRKTHGRIVNISSVAAPASIPFQAYYSASKSAVNSYTLALANEVRPYGITVCAVQPGDTATGFTGAREKSILGDDVYGGRISRSVSTMEHDEQNGMSAEAAGRFIARVAKRKDRKPLYTIGIQYKAVVVLLKLLPARFSNWLIGLIYAK